MNNNMPNNFNNGMPNGGNNPVGNGMPNPVEQAAKEQLVGGQSAVGNGPAVMQGMPNVQNGPGVVQGVGAVPNTPNPVPGANPAPKPEPAPAMPGQGNSGINAMTMQKEEPKKDSPDVVSIPNFAPNIPEPPVAPQPGVVQTPNPVPGANPTPNPSVNMPNQIGNPTNPLNNTMNMPNVNGPKPSVAPTTPNTVGGNVIGGPAPNTIGQVNNQNLNGFPSDNINQMNKPQTNIGMVPPTPNNAPKDLNNTTPSINTGVSQIGTADTSALDNDVVEMPDMPEKKFPLSTREMILIGIALVGIVAVIIMYT